MPKRRVDRVGQEKVQNSGLTAKIIRYGNAHDIDVLLSDGRVLEHKNVSEFDHGSISGHGTKGRRKRNYIGEKRMQNCGLEAEIIEYRSNKDIDVLFDNGNIVTKRTYSEFRNGSIPEKAKKVKKGIEHIGDTIINKQGKKVTLIRWIKSTDITVRFEDGTVREHISYEAFKDGNVPHLSDKKDRRGLYSPGTTSIHGRTGQKITILGGSRDNLTVRFDDGTIVHGAHFKNFIKGTIGHPAYKQTKTERLGEKRMSVEGFMMEVIAYRKCADIDVLFDNGKIRRHVNYADFKRGILSPESRQDTRDARVGETNINWQGFPMTVVSYERYEDVIVRFGDGAKTKTRYGNFLRGQTNYPHKNEYAGFTLKPAWKDSSGHYYICTCKNCGYQDILTPEQMEKHAIDHG